MALKALFKITIQTPKQSTELLLTQETVTVGRSIDNEVCVESVGISRKHLRIENRDGDLTLTDLGSTNGTIYQGVKLKPNVPVPYTGGPIFLGPVTDGNRIELTQESALKENTSTLTRAKILEAAARAAAKEKERERELSRINSPSISFEAPKVVIKEPSRVIESPAPVQNIVSRPVEERILEGMREEIRRLRIEQQASEDARRGADLKRDELEDESRRLRQEVDSLEKRLSEISGKLQTEEAIFLSRRDELSRERDALHRLERETSAARDELEKRKSVLDEELERIRHRAEHEVRDAREAHSVAMESLRLEQKLLKERLDSENTKLKKQLDQEAADTRKKFEEDCQAARKKAEAEIAATRERFADEKKRLDDDLADHIAQITQERQEIDELHESFIGRLRDDEAKLKEGFEAVEKKHRVQLETLVAEIALKEAKEQKVIEERKTERLIAERELSETRQQLDSSRKELAALHKNVLSVQEQLVRREKEEEALQESIGKSQKEHSKLRGEIQKCVDTVASHREELARLETALAEQRKKNAADLESAAREAQETKRSIIAEGEAEAEAHRRRSEEALSRELDATRAEARARLEAEAANWTMELSRRKARETEEMNLWFAEEKRKLQDRLSGDLSHFVETVTSNALAPISQNPQFGPLIHEFHSRFTRELRDALTRPQEQFVAQFNPDRKKSTRTFWAKSAVAAILVAAVGVLAKVAPDYIRDAAEHRRASHDDGATGEWVKKIQAEREQRLALKLETRADFQFSYSQNVLYNEGYLEMKLEPSLQSAWVKELNQLLTGEKAMGMDDEALVEYVRIEHALFVDLAEKKTRMNAINKDEFIQQMDLQSKKAVQDLVLVLKTKALPSSDRARQTTPEQKWRAIRELERKFYSEHVLQSERRPAAK